MIRQLDNNTINKIAAGEVIENPKSIIKELVENSIDAGADEVIIEIKNGGKTFIRITDNGSGIKKDQIEDAFKRHYTSKINNASDLEDLHTLGFRGEALASIAAVSKVEVVSRTNDDVYGTKFVIEGGKTVLKEEVGCPIGTTFIVTDLFYNVPARLKFLKSDSAESSSINEIVTSLALSVKEVSIKYINNNKPVFKTPKSNKMINAISVLYDKELANSLIEFNFQNDYLKVKGYVSNLNYYRGNRKYQLIFVNGRYVKHKRIGFFIEAAYNTMLPKDKHPACFLNIEIDNELVDVNVHPAKTEIRVKNEEKFLKDIKYAVQSALNRANLVKEVKSDNFNKKTGKTEKREIGFASIKEVFVEDSGLTAIFDTGNTQTTELDFLFERNAKTIEIIDSDISDEDKKNIYEVYEKQVNDRTTLYENKDIYSINELDIAKKNDFNKIDIIEEIVDFDSKDSSNVYKTKKNDQVKIGSDNISVVELTEEEYKDKTNRSAIAELRVIGTTFKTYILCENADTEELYMIDQHAAHERLNYEAFLSQIESRKINLQELLIPEVINLSYDEYHIVIENKDFFEKIGIPVDSFGINDIIINSIPLIFIDTNVKDLFFTVLDSIKDVRKNVSLDLEMHKIIKKACVKSVKAGDNLQIAEIKRLLEDLSKAENPYTCPHGRPTIIKMTKYEIERMFERIQI